MYKSKKAGKRRVGRPCSGSKKNNINVHYSMKKKIKQRRYRAGREQPHYKKKK